MSDPVRIVDLGKLTQAILSERVTELEAKLKLVEASRKELYEALLALTGSFPDPVLAERPGTMRLVRAALDNASKVQL